MQRQRGVENDERSDEIGCFTEIPAFMSRRKNLLFSAENADFQFVLSFAAGWTGSPSYILQTRTLFRDNY